MATQDVKEIALTRLNVDTGNFRLGEFDDRREAYKAMILDQGDDLVNLAQDIIEHGLSPAERLIVVPDPDEDGHFIVCEGNRRITALKILETPELAAGTDIEKAFNKLSKQYLSDPIRRVECLVLSDKDAAFPWIQRKHTRFDGRGISSWTAPAQARAEAYAGRVRPSKAVLDHLRDKNLISASLETGLRRRTTNLDRVFQMPYLRKSLGVIIEKNGNVSFENGKTKDGNALLLNMVHKLIEKDFNVNKIRSAEQREQFIDSFSNQAVTGQSTSNAVGGKKLNRKASSTLERNWLALRGREYAMVIRDPRLNRLYDEALTIRVDKYPNCAAILTRVFLELATELYLVKKKIAIPEKHKKVGRNKWADLGITLKEKIQIVLSNLDPDRKDRSLTDARRALGGDSFIHSVFNLHQYLHDSYSDIDPKEVKRIWERWHHYFYAIFSSIKS